MKRKELRYDLHIHSCLSPCAEDEMTPTALAGFAKLAGIELIAVTDHNTALNLPAAQKACKAYGLCLLPGIEVNTAEGIHLLCYFPSVDKALQMGTALYEKLPPHPFEKEVWGRQLVMDENDVLLHEPEKLLASPVQMDLYEVWALCGRLQGICVPAHVDRDTSSLLSVLGFAPDDLPFAAFEVSRPEHTLQTLLHSGRLPKDREILTSSDAHELLEISEYPRKLRTDSVLWPLLEGWKEDK